MKLDEFVEGEIEEADNSAYEEWQDMPEFLQEDNEAFAVIRVRFENAEAVKDFAKKIGQSLTDKTKAIWYPKKEHELTRWIDT